MSEERLNHPFPPLYGAGSKTLILGSFPSVKSREQRFFYGHPQNRFWRVLAALYQAPVPQTVEEKTALVLSNGLALWDVIGQCTITGSSDSSIRGAAPNDLSVILDHCEITRIFTNGKTAAALYEKHLLPQTGIPAPALPSTSPANAAWDLEKLIEAWKIIL